MSRRIRGLIEKLETAMKSAIVKRSVIIAGHKTSVSLEDAFWKSLREIAIARHSTISDLVAWIDSERRHGNLSSAIRLFVLGHCQGRPNGYHEVGQAPHELIVSPPATH
jgi:predicted DNA-binding ribbon-helix-helix protein